MPNLWRSSGQPEPESAPHRTASKVYLYIEKLYLGTNVDHVHCPFRGNRNRLQTPTPLKPLPATERKEIHVPREMKGRKQIIVVLSNGENGVELTLKTVLKIVVLYILIIVSKSENKNVRHICYF
jgi:hypothetical protein